MSICAVSETCRSCHDCGHPSGTYARCGDCRDNENARRDDRQAHGQCRRCGAPVALLGDRRCPRCVEERRKAAKERYADDKAAGVCTYCRTRRIVPPAQSLCAVCASKKQKAEAVRRPSKAEQKRLDFEHGNLLLRQTIDALLAEGIDPPAELLEHCRERGIEC